MRTAFDGAHLSRIENGLRPPTRALALACDVAFPERRGWYTDYYDESRQWAEVPPGFRDWSEIEDKAVRCAPGRPASFTGYCRPRTTPPRCCAPRPAPATKPSPDGSAARMERQRRVILRDIPPAACFVVDEMALYRLVGTARRHDRPAAPAPRRRRDARHHHPGPARGRPPCQRQRLRHRRRSRMVRARGRRVRLHRPKPLGHSLRLFDTLRQRATWLGRQLPRAQHGATGIRPVIRGQRRRVHRSRLNRHHHGPRLQRPRQCGIDSIR